MSRRRRGRRPRNKLWGKQARDRILSRLASHPGVQALAADVVDFYGDHFLYREVSGGGVSRCGVELAHRPLALRHAHIRLELAAGRLPEVLAHELLHLRLPILGFPVSDGIDAPDELRPLFESDVGKVENLVHHELIAEDLAGYAFDRSHFVWLPTPEDYDLSLAEQRALRTGHPDKYDPSLFFPWWCLQHTWSLRTACHTGNDELVHDADAALACGGTLHPELGETVQRIGSWFADGCFRDTREYPFRVNDLLGLMGLPRIGRWAHLARDDPGAVTVTLIDL